MRLISILQNIGVKVKKHKPGEYEFHANKIDKDYLDSQEYKDKAKGLRGSVMLVGPLLARFGKGCIPRPGGDKIGRRRLDTHFEGLKSLGANFNYDKDDHFSGDSKNFMVLIFY